MLLKFFYLLKLYRKNALAVPKLNKLLFSINKKIDKVQKNILSDMKNEYKFLRKTYIHFNGINIANT